MFTSKRGFGEYNSLDDYYLQGYFTNKQLRKELRKAGLINRDGTPVPESIYRTNVAKAERRKKEKDELTKCLVAESINLQWQYENEIKSRLEEIQKLERVRKLRLETRTVNKKPQTKVKKKDLKHYLTLDKKNLKRAQSLYSENGDTEHIRTLMTVQFLDDAKYLGEIEDETESPKEIYVEQTTHRQNLLWVYTGKHKSLDIFQFNTYRHSSFPFCLNMYVNGMLHLKINSCCEYKYPIGTRLGGSSGKFILLDIQGYITCGSPECETNRNIITQISEQCTCHKSCGVAEEGCNSPCHVCITLEENSSGSRETSDTTNKCACTGGFCPDGSASLINSEDYQQEIKGNKNNLSEKGITSDKASYGSTTYEEAIHGTDRKKNNDMKTDSQKAPNQTEAEPQEEKKEAEPKENKAAVPAEAEALPVGVKQSRDDKQIKKTGNIKETTPSKTREPPPPAKSPSPIKPSSTLAPPQVKPSPLLIEPISSSLTPPPVASSPRPDPPRPPVRSSSSIEPISSSLTPPPVTPSPRPDTPRPPVRSPSLIEPTSSSPTPPPVTPSPQLDDTQPPVRSPSPIEPTSNPTPPPVTPSPQPADSQPPVKSPLPIEPTSLTPTPPQVTPSPPPADPQPPVKSPSPIEPTSLTPTPPPADPQPQKTEKSTQSQKTEPPMSDNTTTSPKETVSKPSAKVVEKKDVGTDAILQVHVCTQVCSHNFMFDKSTETTFDNVMEENSLTIITDFENSVLWKSSPIFAPQ